MDGFERKSQGKSRKVRAMDTVKGRETDEVKEWTKKMKCFKGEGKDKDKEREGSQGK